MAETYWQKCTDYLKDELPVEQFNTWIRPLRAETHQQTMVLYAPNRFIVDWVRGRFLERISELMLEITSGPVEVTLEVNQDGFQQSGCESRVQAAKVVIAEPAESQSKPAAAPLIGEQSQAVKVQYSYSKPTALVPQTSTDTQKGILGSAEPGTAKASTVSTGQNGREAAKRKLHFRGVLNPEKNFDTFIVGKSNQLARAAAIQVADNPGRINNPLFIYGGVGLGKTHLMQAIGNSLKHRKAEANVVFLHSETFVNTMVSAITLNAMNEFKRFYRAADALLIDDIQFFIGKGRSQEELFHTFNTLLEGGQQIILTCDRFHKELTGIEDRLISRFGWGLTVAVDPPDLETRAAILMKKAALRQTALSQESALFIAQRVRSNVRELEGALKRVTAHADFKGSPIDPELINDALRDLFAVQEKKVSIDNIKRIVAEYYKIKMGDMLTKRRNRSVARPRQIAMALSKELTNHSLPEIGDAFGGRDHSTVIHACKKIEELCKSKSDIKEDYTNLLRSLSA
ncbi:MAG: chromosomal replication initiator protein DnaA [Gammaproteobacteria bacterium]|nr:chromosomal replication initiator protein DnaA [Gammaproteobacteria bacterium]